MTDPISFHSYKDPWGYFSNFAPYAIYLDGKIWPTVEHYYQAKKFTDTEHEEHLRQAKSAEEAAMWGKDDTRPMRDDWDDIRVDVMRDALYAKFTQHPNLKEHLLRTGDAVIIEDPSKNSFWGVGSDGHGLNTFGQLIMETRDRIRKEAES